jgi:hypothetical protein
MEDILQNTCLAPTYRTLIAHWNQKFLFSLCQRGENMYNPSVIYLHHQITSRPSHFKAKDLNSN